MDELVPHPGSQPRRWQLVASAGLVLASALAATMLSTGFPNGVFEDDAYFYLRIAANLAHGISSFDGREVTSGYHPLWAWMLALAQPLTWFAGEGARVVAVFVAASMGTLLLWRLAGGMDAPLGAVAASLAFGWLTGLIMEGVLAAVLVVGLVSAWEARRPPWQLVLIAAALPLARLEQVAVPLVLCAVAAVRTPGRRRHAAAVGVGAVVGLAALAAWNYGVDGYPASISSVVKASQFDQLPFSAMALRNVSGGNALRWLVVVLVGGVSLRALRRAGRTDALIMLSTVLAVLLVLACSARVRDWYFAPAALCSVALMPWRGSARSVVVGVAALSAAALAYDVARNADDARQTRAFVERVNAIYPAGEPIYQVDGSGFTGYWLDAPVINGDGVVNSFEHLRALREVRLVPWLRERRIRHVLLNHADGANGDLLNHADLHLSTANVHEIAKVSHARNQFSQFRLVRVDALD